MKLQVKEADLHKPVVQKAVSENNQKDSWTL